MKNTAQQRLHRRRRSSSTLRSGWELDSGREPPHHLVPRRRVVHPAGRSGCRRVAHVSSTPPASVDLPGQARQFPTMTLVVDIRHWLDKNQNLPDHDLRLRRNALRIASFIEYGGPLKRKDGRETLLPCKRRPGRKPCLGLMWVMKRDDDYIEAFCFVCKDTEAVVTGWQETEWAEGPMEPAPMMGD